VSIIINANNGWYLTNVTYSGPSTSPNLNPAQQFAKMLSVDAFLQPGFDPSTITNDSVTLTLTADSTVTAVFAPLAPTFGQQAESEIVIAGTAVTLGGSASGRQPITYQWQFDGTNLAGATDTSLVLSDLDETNSGTYTLVASNSFGMATNQPIVLTVQEIEVFVNWSLVSSSNVVSYLPVIIALESFFPDGDLFYSLDGSTPDFTANFYNGEFEVTNSCVLQVITYSADFSETSLSQPLRIQILPSFSVWDATPGGGYVALDPPSGLYPSNSTVTVTAIPAAVP
jgi:hypothetical protein